MNLPWSVTGLAQHSQLAHVQLSVHEGISHGLHMASVADQLPCMANS